MAHGHWREAFDEVSGAIQALARLQTEIEKNIKILEETVMELSEKISKANTTESKSAAPKKTKKSRSGGKVATAPDK